MRYFRIVYILVIFSTSCYGQGETDNWLFGWSVRMNFATNPPSVQPGVNSLFSGTACMSDKNGNLLFYSDGVLVYNRLHQPMPSCLPNLTGNTVIHGNQCVLTVPYPGHDSLYFLFYIEHQFFTNYTPRLRYAIINMNAQNGLGDVVQKDILLLGGDSICLKMTASLHCNKKDIWLIGHLKNSTNYFSYLITQSGISASPILSSCNNIDNSDVLNYRGYMKVSPMGDKIAAGFIGNLDMVELSDFNSQTGVVSNPKKLRVRPAWALANAGISGTGPCGVEFSPSGRFLYVGSLYDIGIPAGHLDQFDLLSNAEASIQASKYFIDSIHLGAFYGMQLANNGAIYITNQNNFLHIIKNPEGAGVSCNYVRNAINTGIATLTFKDLPSFLQSYLRFPVISTGNCQFQNISFSVQNQEGVSNILWDFGDPVSGGSNSSTSFNPVHIFTAEGSYLVKAVLYNTNGCAPDTINKLIHAGPFKVFLGNDTTICQKDTLLLKMNIPNAHNNWSNNTVDTVMPVTQSGTYWVRTNIGECVTTDTINVSFQALPAFSLGNDTTVCSNQPLLLAANNSFPGTSYLWNNGTVDPTITVNNAGDYWLGIKDNLYGCRYYDTISVQFKPLPSYSLGNDMSICEGNTVSLNAAVTGATNYLWSTGNTSSNINVIQSDIYWADVTKDQCTYRDSISIVFKPLPVVNFGKDTTLCEGQTLLLDAGNPGSQYQWQNNSTSQSFNVISPGQYFVKTITDGCSWADTIKIQYDLKPVFTLGANFGICEGQTILLQPIVQSSSAINYLWQNGSTASSFPVTQPDTYKVDISNYCGSKTDEIAVSKGVCKLYVPTAFSPNDDGLNDIFKAEYGENITAFKLEIYNRWGQQIFSSKTIRSGWNGKLNGVIQPNGAYIWVIRYKSLDDPNEVLLKGTMMLIR